MNDENTCSKTMIDYKNMNSLCQGMSQLPRETGWQTSREHKEQIFLNIKGEFWWTLFHEMSSFWVNFCGDF